VDDALDSLFRAINDPIDPDLSARELAALGVVATATIASDLRHRRRVIGWLLGEIDQALPWKSKPAKRRPDHRRVPRKDRAAALLAAIGAWATDGDAPRHGRRRVAWILEQTAREHFGCHPPRSAHRDEIPFEHPALDAMARPLARDGHGHTSALGPEPEGGRVTHGYVSALAQLPEDPETIYGREEAIRVFRKTLSRRERETFDLPCSEPGAIVASRIGTTWKTVKTTRARIRQKASRWGTAVSIPNGRRAA
jgi:hypothetical protein